METTIHRLTGFAYFARLVRSAVARRIMNSPANRKAAQIACFPRDDIGSDIVVHGWYEDTLLEAIFEGAFSTLGQFFSEGCAVDVGANIGNHSMWFSRRFRQVVAFEPNPVCIKLFEANVLMNQVENVRLFTCGLSDTDGVALFHSNLAGNLGRSGVEAEMLSAVTRSFEIDLRRGDAVVTQEVLRGVPVRLLKLDVEGHEFPALQGLQETLLAHRPLVLFESHRATGPSGSDAIVEALSRWGYRHVYVVETSQSRGGNKLIKFLNRLARGQTWTLREVDKPADRSYALVIVTPFPLINPDAGVTQSGSSA